MFMNKDGNKVVWIALSVACFILLWATVTFYAMEESERGKKNALQKRFDDVTVVKDGLTVKLKEAEALAVELKTRLKTQEETIATTTEQLTEERNANNKNLLKLQGRENEIRAMETKLQDAALQKNDLLKKIEKVSQDYANLKTQLENESKAKDDNEKKAKETAEREGVSLGTIVVDQKAK